MISIMRAGYSPENPTGSRVINELTEDYYNNPKNMIRIIVIKRQINPEEFEDEVSDMGEREEDNLSQEELDQAENEIPAEVDTMSMEELGLTEDDIDDMEDGVTGEPDESGGDMTEEELAALEKEIPPEVDQMKDDEIGLDSDLDEDEAGEVSGDMMKGMSKEECEMCEK